MTHDHFGSSLERTRGGEEIEGALEETQEEGRRKQAPLLTTSAGLAPAPQICGLSTCKKMEQTYAVFRGLAWETNCRWQEDAANSRRHSVDLF